MFEKVCQRCGRYLPLSEFCRNKRQKDGLHNWCKSCTKEYKAKYYLENKERLSQESKERYAKDPERYRASERARREANKELYNKRALEYQKRNREKVYARQNAWVKKQRQTNPNFKIRQDIRRAMYRFIKGIQSGGRILKFIGCTQEEYRAYMEERFKDGMTWETYGKTWTVDHIKPLTMFDLTNPEELAEAVYYENTQPLSISENVKKGGYKRSE